MHGALLQVRGHLGPIDVRKQSERAGHVLVGGAVITQLDEHPQVRLDEVGKRVSQQGDSTQRDQQRQILAGQQDVGGQDVR
ncbi:Uncharacterised protein [Mycobacterium tuberculosis]|uniref:Uncharacterized protein n=1 Tax=Mycobacterium tuberculosis TaxID=1773 RepID=A0A916LE88_MYCTX|nr:Uncharacterised protein [Mycobacterium tuberculosis]COW72373.1 Uncharacterised protein [Mycobacterium tuberculosis]COZ58635.1 Uncharacterised protein [Mycobacterium tuberculosis]